MAAAKKENALEGVVLVAGTLQNLSNLYSLDTYRHKPSIQFQNFQIKMSMFQFKMQIKPL
jgi:hypothetical protein